MSSSKSEGKRPWCWERLRARKGGNRGWEGWMASLSQWTWVWVNSGSWWWTGRPGVLQSMGSQRVGHNWATELNSTQLNWFSTIIVLTIHEQLWGSPGGTSDKEPACQCRRHKRHRFKPWDRKIPRRRAWQPTPAFLPGESCGQRSLAGYSPEGCKELDMTEHEDISNLSLL